MTKESVSYQLSLDSFSRQKSREPQPIDALEHQAAYDVMLEAMGEFGATLRGVFECMEIAEEEITVAQHEHPHKAEEFWNSFTYLRPSPILEPLTPQLYRAHVLEMIDRIASDQTKKAELEAATAAELCCVFCAASQAYGLRSDAAVAYQKLFNWVFPDAVIANDPVIQESYPGRADEIIAELRRKFQQPRRG